MIIAKLSRPCKDGFLYLYCLPSKVADVISDLLPADLVDTSVVFINVVE